MNTELTNDLASALDALAQRDYKNCKLTRTARSLDPDVGSRLLRLVEETEVPLRRIEATLKISGHPVSRDVITKHRLHLCSCESV